MAKKLVGVHFVGGGSDRALRKGGSAAMWDGKHIIVAELDFDPRKRMATVVGKETADGTILTYEFHGCPLVVKYEEVPEEPAPVEEPGHDSTPAE